jgi:hypothetical protein
VNSERVAARKALPPRVDLGTKVIDVAVKSLEKSWDLVDVGTWHYLKDKLFP